MGLQLGYTKFCCFLCERDSRDKKNHYIKKEWPKHESLTPGQKNVVHPSLVNSDMIIIPSLHIKLGHFKNFFKALDKNGAGFYYAKENFSHVNDSKIKEGIFEGPQIKALIRDGKFEDLLSQIEKSAWKTFKSVVKNLLGNRKPSNYLEIVGELLQSYQDMGCNMSFKIHFLETHLNFFLDNLGAVSDEHEERFHQDNCALEKRYQGQRSARMLSGDC